MKLQDKLNATLLGALCVTACMFLLGLSDNFIPFFADDIGVFQFMVMRGALVLAGLFVCAKLTGWRLRPVSTRNVALRSLLYGIAMIAYFGSLDQVPVAHAAAALFTAPLFMVLFTSIQSRRTVGPFRLFSVMLGFAGVMLILRPFNQDVSLFILLPLGAAIFYALGLMSTRRLCAHESTPCLVLGLFLFLTLFGTVGLILTTYFVPFAPEQASFLTRGWQPVTQTILVWMCIQAVFAGVSMSLQTRGYQLADASMMSIFEYSFLVFATFWSVVIWDLTLTGLDFLGMAMIFVAGSIIALRSVERPDEPNDHIA